MDTASATTNGGVGVSVYVSIGNSDNHLTQAEWGQFTWDVKRLIQTHAEDIFGEWYSLPNSEWQNACWCFIPEGSSVDDLRRQLGHVCRRYRQDSIMWSESVDYPVGPGGSDAEVSMVGNAIQ